MFEVVSEGDALRVFHNGRLVISHEPDEPFAWAGKGSWTVGELGVSDAVRGHAPLTTAQYDDGKKLLRLSGGVFSLSFRISERDGCLALTPQRSTTGLNRLKLSFPARPGQAVYGAGAQYGGLNCRGKRIPLWVRERRVVDRVKPLGAAGFVGHAAHPSHFPLPVFFTQEWTWYAFDCSTLTVFDFKSPRRHVVEFWELPAGVTVGAESAAADIPPRLGGLWGRQPLLPQWTIDGVCLEVSGGSRHVAERLENMAGVSISSLLILDWSGTKDTPAGPRPFYDWIWNQELYPKLDAFILGLGERGIKTMAYVTPHLSIEGRQYAEAAMLGYLVRKPQGGNYIHDFGGFMAGHADLSNPSACAWFRRLIQENILSLGFCGYFADMGDFLPADAVLHSGEGPLKIRNRWPVQWAKIHRDAIREAGRTMDSVFFTRSGWAGSGGQTMFATTGSHNGGWEKASGLPSALTASLSLACSGIGLSHSVCGGGETGLTRRSKELLLRWLDYAAFTPFMRVPVGRAGGWQVDTDAETLGQLVRMSRVHRGISTYMRACVKDNASLGLPVMRPLFLEFPGDERASAVEDCYMLGGELLVAPVLARGQKNRRIYLPDGEWVHFWNGRTYRSGEETVSAAFGKPPVFFRAGGKHHELFADIPRKL